MDIMFARCFVVAAKAVVECMPFLTVCVMALFIYLAGKRK